LFLKVKLNDWRHAKLTLSEIMRILEDFGVFVVIILLAYVVYKVGALVEVITNKIKGGKD